MIVLVALTQRAGVQVFPSEQLVVRTRLLRREGCSGLPSVEGRLLLGVLASACRPAAADSRRALVELYVHIVLLWSARALLPFTWVGEGQRQHRVHQVAAAHSPDA